MAKESVKVKASLENVLSAIDAHKKDKGHLPEGLECDVETYSNLHTAVFGTFDDKDLNKLVNDRGLKAKASYLTRVKVGATNATVTVF